MMSAIRRALILSLATHRGAALLSKGPPAAEWCESQEPPIEIPDKQISAAFLRKAPQHAAPTGQICLVLPHGTLFHPRPTALDFQRDLFRSAPTRWTGCLTWADYQRFLFEEAGHAALVLVYRPSPPSSMRHAIDYWAPKVDWLVLRAEVITISPEDRSTFTVRDVLADLEGVDAPQIWKRRFWATTPETGACLIECLAMRG